MRRQVGQAALLHGQPQSDRVWLAARDGLIKGPEGVGSRGGQEGERQRAPLQKGSANSGHFGWYSLNILYSRRASVNFTIHRGHADGGLRAALLVLCLLMTYMCRVLNSVHFWAYHHCHPVGHTHRYKWPFMWSPWREEKALHHVSSLCSTVSKLFFWAQGLGHSTCSTSDSCAVWASQSSSGTRVLPEHTLHLVLWCGSHFPARWDQPRAAGGPWEVYRGLEVQQELEKPFLERERAMRGMAGSRRPASSLYRVPLLYLPLSGFVGRIYPPNIQGFTSEAICVAFFFCN